VYDLGQKVFGENKVQELIQKYPQLRDAEWHLIGHLQSNKVKMLLTKAKVGLIHSVDSEKILSEIQKVAAKESLTVNCLLQFNISNEESKSGMQFPEAEAICQKIESYSNVQVVGLMGIAEETDEVTIIRQQFRSLAEAKGKLSKINGKNLNLKELSMGMSHDYQIAIEEGATLLRIGSAIFGQR